MRNCCRFFFGFSLHFIPLDPDPESESLAPNENGSDRIHITDTYCVASNGPILQGDTDFTWGVHGPGLHLGHMVPNTGGPFWTVQLHHKIDHSGHRDRTNEKRFK